MAPSDSVTLTLDDLSHALNEMGLTSVPAEELFRRLQLMPHSAPPLGSTIPSTGTQNIVAIHVNALEAALANLNLTDISAAQLITTIKKEERSLSASGPEWKNTKPPGAFPPYTSTFRMEPAENDERARLLKLRDLDQQHHFQESILNLVMKCKKPRAT